MDGTQALTRAMRTTSYPCIMPCIQGPALRSDRGPHCNVGRPMTAGWLPRVLDALRMLWTLRRAVHSDP